MDGLQKLRKSEYYNNSKTSGIKIVHFSWEFPPVIWGGLGTFASEITRKQVAIGNEVTLFTLNNENKLNTSEKWNGVEIHRPKTLDLTSSLFLFSNRDVQSWKAHFNFFANVINYNITSASHLINLLVRKQGRSFDIIDAHDWLGIIGGIIVKKELDIPLIFHLHSTEIGRSGGNGSQTIKNFEFEGSKFANAVITVSYAMRDELQRLGFQKEKIRVCWNGIDPYKYNSSLIPHEKKMNLRKRYGVKIDENLLFFIGRLVSVKGVDNLIKAMPIVLRDFPNTKLVILGVGGMENSLRLLIKQNGLNKRVILRTEFVNEDERILHYAASNVVVLPSIYEPFGIVCTEAMSMEKPVVVGASGTSGMREQVIPSGNNQCGIHINPYEPNDIAWGITQVLESREKSRSLGKNARKRIKELFTWDAVAYRTSEIYKEFIS